MFQPRQSKSNFLDSMFGHSTANNGHKNETINRDLLEKLMEDGGDESENEFDLEAFTPLLREEEEKDTFDFITGAKNKKKKKKCKKIKEPKIIPVISSAEAYGEAPHPNLLRPPFSMLIIAPKGSGKTTVSINLESFYDGAFDNRIMVSPTFKIDDNWKAAIRNKVIKPYLRKNISGHYNDLKINKIWKAIKKENKGKDMFGDKLKTHFLFDDIIGELPRTRDNAMYKIARNHRHYGVSSTIIAQEYNGLATPIRKNATGIILFGTTDGGEIKTITEQQGGYIGKNRFLRMWCYCISKPFGFLFINKDQKDKHRYYCYFTEELNPLSFSNERVKDMVDEMEKKLGDSPNDNDNTGNKIEDIKEDKKEKKRPKKMIIDKKLIKAQKERDAFEAGVKITTNEVKRDIVNKKNIMPKELKKVIKGKKEIVIEEVPQKDLKVCKCKMKVIKDITNICPNGLALLADALHIENTEEMSKEDLIKKLSKFKLKVLKLVLAREKKKMNNADKS